MFEKLCRLVQVSVLLAPIAISVAEISVDYYFGDNLRSDLLLSLDCNADATKKSCEAKCGPNHACLLGKCFCIKEDETPDEDSDEADSSEEDKYTIKEFFDYTEITPEAVFRPLITEVIEPKPVLRHHIAHFCPNLNAARDCIRNCRSTGKPAFCGKDHVCYCGHKYDYPVNDDANPADVYAEFKDMYEKYFGPKVDEIWVDYCKKKSPDRFPMIVTSLVV